MGNAVHVNNFKVDGAHLKLLKQQVTNGDEEKRVSALRELQVLAQKHDHYKEIIASGNYQ